MPRRCARSASAAKEIKELIGASTRRVEEASAVALSLEEQSARFNDAVAQFRLRDEAIL